MSRFKVLLIGAIPPPYIGPSSANFNLIRSQLLNKHFHIIHLDTSDRRNSNNIGNFDIGNAWLAIQHIYQFIILLRHSRPDLIYLPISQGLWGIIRDLGFIIPSILTKCKVIIHLRGSEFDCVYKSLPIVIKQITRWALKRISAAIVLGKSLTYIFDGLVPQDKIHVIPNGIDPFPYTPDQPYELRKNILFLATLKKRKGIFEFLHALPEVLKKHPEIKITIAGAWRNESEELAAQNLITELSISHAINFVGEVSGHNKYELYKRHAIFVFPPIEPEGLPWVILEAMSAGMPVISTAQGTIPEVMVHNKNGFIVNPVPGTIGKKINYLLENTEEATKMGENSLLRISQLFSEQQYFENLKILFTNTGNEKLLSETKPSERNRIKKRDIVN